MEHDQLMTGSVEPKSTLQLIVPTDYGCVCNKTWTFSRVKWQFFRGYHWEFPLSLDLPSGKHTTRRRMARERRGAESSVVSMETLYYKIIY